MLHPRAPILVDSTPQKLINLSIPHVDPFTQSMSETAVRLLSQSLFFPPRAPRPALSFATEKKNTNLTSAATQTM